MFKSCVWPMAGPSYFARMCFKHSLILQSQEPRNSQTQKQFLSYHIHTIPIFTTYVCTYMYIVPTCMYLVSVSQLSLCLIRFTSCCHTSTQLLATVECNDVCVYLSMCIHYTAFLHCVCDW